MAISRKVKKEFIEWGILLGIVGFLYLTGLHTEVAGFLQRIILSTGIIQPDIENNKHAITTLESYDFKVKSLENEEVLNFSEFKGELVFLNFWATWCAPCVAEMPSIHELYQDYQDKDIKFVLISSEDDIEKIRKFIERKDYDFPVYQLVSGVPNELYSKSIPTTFVIDEEGQILLRNTGMANYNSSRFREFIDSHL